MSESTLTDRPVTSDLTGERRRAFWPTVRSRLGARSMLPVWLTVIVLVGAFFRLTGVDWDEGHHLHPDERFLSDVVNVLEWPKDNFWSQYFNEATSTLNPRNVGKTFFVYGDFPVIFTKGVGVAMDRLVPRADGASWHSYGHNYRVGRVLDALMDLGALLVLFALARRLYRDDRIALLAALLYAGTALAIQQSHFFVVDSFTTFFVTITLYFAVGIAQRGALSDYLLAGVFFGVSFATKLSVYSLALIVALAGGYRLYIESKEKGLEWATERAILRLSLAGIAALVAFRVLQPSAFAGLFEIAPRWWANAQEARAWVSGDRDAPFAHQWTNRTVWWFPWKNMVLWGMGPALGLTAWAGWGVALYQLLRRQKWVHLIPVAWVGLLFFQQGAQWVKSLRYFLPIYPVLALLAAWLLVTLWERARASAAGSAAGPARFWRPPLALLLLVVVTGATLIYAFGFSSIYRRPHTRVAASDWIYENLPEGAVIANETVWDDGLPLFRPGQPNPNQRFVTEIDGRAADDLTAPPRLSTTLNITDEDDPGKWFGRPDASGVIQPGILDRLDQIDYYLISSNRQYDSMARLPMRYPAVINFYDALFSGALGFERVAEFTSYPHFLGIPLPDQGAEEAWTVYDHNRVQIWKKTEAYDRARAEALILGDVDFAQVQQLWPRDVAGWVGPLTLDSASWQQYRASGSWANIFDRGSLANRLPLPIWILALELLGLIAIPYLLLIGRTLPDRGYTLAKTLGLLLVGWGVWMSASLRLLPFVSATIWIVIAVVALGAVALAFREQRLAGGLAAWWRRDRRPFLMAQALFWGFFALVLAIRWANPDLWHPILGGEKPMDLAYLNATIKSRYFPPLDPWFAQGYINYYYFGFVLVATLIKLTGIVPEVAYNLVLPALFAMLATGVFGVALALGVPLGAARPSRRALGGALLAAILVAVAGNLGELKVLTENLPTLSTLTFESGIPGVERLVKSVDGLLRGVLLGGQPIPGRIEWPYWNPTRVIPETINEFPWFTFLYADLHAHMMALPYTVLALALAVAVLRAPRAESRLAEGGRLALLALVVGALWPINTWDYPTYALVAFGAIGLREWRRHGGVTLAALVGTLWRWGLVLVAGRLLFQPFHANYGSAYSSVQRWQGSRTGMGEFLTVHGLFLFAIFFGLIADLLHGRGHNGAIRLVRFWLAHLGRRRRALALYDRLVRPAPVTSLLFAGGLLLGAAGLGAMVAGWAVPGGLLLLLTLTLLLLLRAVAAPLWQMALLMIALGLGLTLAVEIVVLEGDIGRMNTVFKFYLQVWVLWGIAAALSVVRVREILPRWAPEWRALWRTGFVTLFAIAMLYPLFATRAKINDRFDRSVGPGLDGMAFMNRAEYFDQEQVIPLADDAAAIRWMQENVPGSPVIAEINTFPKLYGWGNRYSIWTGNPAIVGWDWHQRQQRAASRPEQIPARIADVQQNIYNAPDAESAYRTLLAYDAEYIVVGPLERAYTSEAGLAKFESARGRLWDLVYENPGVRIYRLLPPAPSS